MENSEEHSPSCSQKPRQFKKKKKKRQKKLLHSLTGLLDAVVLKWLPLMTSADSWPVAEL